MRVRRPALMVLLVLACRPAEPDSSTTVTVTVTVTPSPSEPGDDDEPTPVEPSPARSSAGWTATLTSSPCELVCADVYSCSLIDGDERSAATIELGCLDACLRAPKAFVACERPGSITADSCPAYLDCARAAWPTQERPPRIVEATRDGCDIACKALARCRGFPEDKAELCAIKCRQTLDAEQQRIAASCGDVDSCLAVERCVNSLPGST